MAMVIIDTVVLANSTQDSAAESLRSFKVVQEFRQNIHHYTLTMIIYKRGK